MEGIKLVASLSALWFVSTVIFGMLLKVMYHVFMIGWNLL